MKPDRFRHTFAIGNSVPPLDRSLRPGAQFFLCYPRTGALSASNQGLSFSPRVLWCIYSPCRNFRIAIVLFWKLCTAGCC
jgi:hypothetical protein